MKPIQLLKLGFKDKSYTDDEGNHFTEFILEKSNYIISVTGIENVEICINERWVVLPNCKNISDLKQLIRLFL